MRRPIDDILQSITGSPRYLGEVAGEYADAIVAHLPEIIGITAGFILAEAASAFLAATPTGVGQLAAVLIQLALAAFGAKGAIEAGAQALEHGMSWLTLAWTAKGEGRQIAAASKEFLKMLVSVAIAALAALGVRSSIGKGLKIAEAIKFELPPGGLAPAMVMSDGTLAAGRPIFVPSVVSTGPVDIKPSLMAGTGAAGSRIATKGGKDTPRSDKEIHDDLDPKPRSTETPAEARGRVDSARAEMEKRLAETKTDTPSTRQIVDRGYPLGFKSRGQFGQFGGAAKNGLAQAGVRDAEVGMQGSAASGRSASTGAPFDFGRLSDLDLAIVSEKLLA